MTYTFMTSAYFRNDIVIFFISHDIYIYDSSVFQTWQQHLWHQCFSDIINVYVISEVFQKSLDRNEMQTWSVADHYALIYHKSSQYLQAEKMVTTNNSTKNHWTEAKRKLYLYYTKPFHLHMDVEHDTHSIVRLPHF
jgi:hypothetical protein